jgi:zinc and cadmium transporter
MLGYIVLAAIFISLLSLTGAVVIGPRAARYDMHRIVLPLAIGVFLGIVFFDLIPETLEGSSAWGPFALVGGFLGFYLLSHILETYHHHGHDHEASVKSGARMLLIGDAIHNSADGIVIATAFMIDPSIGLLTTIGIALHEIPQEIAEFGVLLDSGYSRGRALAYNFLSATTVILGALLAYFFAASLHDSIFILTGIAAGNLLYIAAADLIPELREAHRGHFLQTFTATLIGVAAIALLITYTHERFEEAGHAHEEESAHRSI